MDGVFNAERDLVNRFQPQKSDKGKAARRSDSYAEARVAARATHRAEERKSVDITAEQFIEYLATGSSMSGKAYEIRLKDGTVVPSAKGRWR